MQFTGLKTAPQLNGTYGTLVKFHKAGPSAGRWGVRKDADGELIAVKPENLEIIVGALFDPTAGSLPSLTDKWNITDTSKILSEKMLKRCRQISADAKTIEQAEKEIYICVNHGNENFEGMAFPLLFPFGTGLFGQRRPVDVRFEDYVRHLLRQYSGNFIKADDWISFVASRAAILRAVTKRPPIWKSKPQNLEPRHVKVFNLLKEIDERKAFCFQYLLGDAEAAGLAELYLHDLYQAQKESGSKDSGK